MRPQEMGVHWLTGSGGRYIGGLAAGASPVQRRIRQYEALQDPGCCFSSPRQTLLLRIRPAGWHYVRRVKGLRPKSTMPCEAFAPH